ncbi:MAG TPA: PepSY domain-containing protein [Oscillatoriales cyanobacterium M59_W2019_021]|nr:PepSY domain-containing protein [Oscillatoriales cyanobacterium M4454_W2019_049]HIK52990.1 PepSY domain-containing protein [Oscillatoriales cyanobacterium M59_W2019_021]
MNLRKLHRKLAPFLFIPLFIAALTGIAYRLGYSWFRIPDEVADFLMVLHEGRYLGEALVPVYVLLVGLGLLGTIATGLTLIRRKGKTSASPPKKDGRWFHRLLAPIAFLPLTVSALTGIAYRLGKAWFGLSNPQAAIFLRIHQGSYLGTTLKPIYVLLVGLGLIGLLMTGIQMSGIFRKRRPQTSENS